MFKPFAQSGRAVASGPLTWRTWVGLAILPVLIALPLAWAFWAPDSDYGTARAAVVNNDKPVKVNGQLVPIGREMAGKLTQNEDSGYRWELTDDEDAREGLNDGTYAAVVTIPSNFSAKATSTSGEANAASQAKLSIQTSGNSGVVDPIASNQIAKATIDTLNRQVVETYLDNIYLGFTTLHGQITTAANGAKQLATGTKQLNTAVGQLNTGAGQLATGTTQLASGSGQLSAGLTQMERDTKQLPTLTRQLASGAQQVATGNQQIANVVVPLANRIIAAIDSMPSAQSAAQRFTQLAQRCDLSGGDSEFCASLRQAAQSFAGKASQIDSVKNTIRAAAVSARDNIKKLAVGAGQVASGTSQLATQTVTLTNAISTAAGGARQLNTGVQQTKTGARALATGTGQLAVQTPKLSTATQQLATGLATGRDQIPSYDKNERERLSKVAATPTAADTSGLPSFGATVVALLIALALWGGALAIYVVTRAVPQTVLTSREASWRIAGRAMVPGATVAVIAATVLSLVLIPVVRLDPLRWFALWAVAMLAALAFTAVNQALVAIIRRPGRYVSLAVLVLTLAAGVVTTVPGFFGAAGALIPTHGAIVALRAITIGSSGLGTGILELVGWLALSLIATVVVTDRRRTLPGRQLRLAAVQAG